MICAASDIGILGHGAVHRDDRLANLFGERLGAVLARTIIDHQVSAGLGEAPHYARADAPLAPVMITMRSAKSSNSATFRIRSANANPLLFRKKSGFGRINSLAVR